MTARPLLLALLCTLTLSACQKPATTAPAGTAGTTTSTPPSGRDPQSGLRWVTAADLPRETGPVLTLIARGGPFPYRQDGASFGNRERLLPRQDRGYYREYTVRTPGESDRGARRIVCGGQPATSLNECYYTGDHYASFRRIWNAPGVRP